MFSCRIGFASLSLFGLIVVPVSGQEPRRDPYVGYEPGSWVIRRTTAKSGLLPRRASREKLIIESIDEGVPMIRRLTEKGGKFVPEGRASMLVQPLDPGKWRVLSTRNKTIEIESKSYDCKVTSYLLERKSGKDKTGCRLWTTDQVNVPYRELESPGVSIALFPNVVRADYRYEDSKMKVSKSMRVTELDKIVAVGGTMIPCVVETWKNEEQSPQGLAAATTTTFLSNEVPGHWVRRESNIKFSDGAVEVIEEVVDFKAKRLPESDTALRTSDFQQRILSLNPDVTIEQAISFNQRLLVLNEEDQTAPITVRIGVTRLDAEFALNMIQMIDKLETSVHTQCPGDIEGFATLLLACGRKGGRTASKDAKISLKGMYNPEVEHPMADGIVSSREFAARRLADITAKPVQIILADLQSGRLLTPKEAIEYGLIDEIASIPDKPGPRTERPSKP